jgi:hypothetical protein
MCGLSGGAGAVSLWLVLMHAEGGAAASVLPGSTTVLVLTVLPGYLVGAWVAAGSGPALREGEAPGGHNESFEH